MIKTKIIITELHEHRSWFLGWLIAFLGFVFMIIAMYPGDEGMRDMMSILEDDLFEAFLGTIGGEDPSYALWQSMMSPFLGMLFAFFGTLLGVRVAMKSISDKTGEIISTLPISREVYLLNKLLAVTIYGLVLLASWFLPLIIPIGGNSLPTDMVNILARWGFLYLMMSVLLGVIIGNLTGSSGRGAQNSVLLILSLFIFNVLVGFQRANLDEDTLSVLTDINFLNWYNPSAVILGEDLDMKYIRLISVAFAIFFILAFITYIKKDHIDERGVFSLYMWRMKNRQSSDDQAYIKPKRSVKTSIYTFWIRPLEKKFPFTADFVYSDRRALMILTFATLLFWPFQLMAYLGDVDAANATGVIEGGMMAVFAMGYDMSIHPPWVWWCMTQAIGISWILMIPMVMRWLRSVPSRDAEDVTGDLIGSLPVKKRDVVFQRLFAVFLELVWISLWFVIWYVLSIAVIDSQVGNMVTEANPAEGIEEVLFEFNNPLNTSWVIIAIASGIIFYMFLTVAGVAINLIFRTKGLKYAKIFLYIVVLLFVMAFAQPNPDLYWISGIMGMYNPVGISIDESFKPGNYGVPILVMLTLLGLIVVRMHTKKFSWVKQDANTEIIDAE
ncbi:MAG: ABC transporter permease subunit [Candidatus Heimdallarchaeota archaeon]|nr:ABC transporter permease subunit [Candidatus Heimdallarchaeota archaeon]